MHRLALAAVALSCGPALCLAAAPSYSVTKTIPLGSPEKWDYLTFDPATHRVLAAHGTHTDVIDGATGKRIGSLDGLKGAHGQAVTPSGDIYADSGDTGTITAFGGTDLHAKATMPAGADADGVIYDAADKLVAVMDGDAKSLTLIDPASRSVRATVPLGGGPEFAAADGAGHIYVNLATTKEIVRVDVAAGAVGARFAVPQCESPHGLAIDPATHRLFASCKNAKLVVLDAASGRVLQTLPIGQGTDAAAVDPVRHLVFSSNRDGTLSVFHEATDGTLTALPDIATPRFSRTLAIDPHSGRIYLVTADATGTEVKGRPAFKPGSVKLLFLDPAAP